MKTNVQKWGNSSAIRLPKPLLKVADIGEKDTVQLIVKKNEIIIRKTAAERKHIPLAERLKNWEGDTYQDGELNWGPPVGEEIW
jgi:antitoxin MazE